MPAAWTLLKAVIKCLCEDYTFLIAANTATHTSLPFFMIALSAFTQGSRTQDFLSKLSHWFRVEPLINACGGNVVVIARIQFVIFLTTDS
jgi:hypothetical protein